MGLLIYAADANGNRAEDRIYKDLPTAVGRAFLKLISEKLTDEHAAIALAHDDEDFAFYGEFASEIEPAALAAAFCDTSAFDDAARSVITAVGLDVIARAAELNQLVRVAVMPSWGGHQATISTDGIRVDEPTIDACYSNALRAFAALGHTVDTAQKSTVRARDLLDREGPFSRDDHHTSRLLDVASFAIHRFGPEATVSAS